MKILITGATGFLGKKLVCELSNAGHELLLISRRASEKKLSGIEWFESNLSGAADLQAKIADFEPEVVYHLAWEGIPDFSEEVSRKNLTQALEFLGPVLGLSSVKRLIVSGSCWEYGARVGACSESLPAAPVNWFTWAKDALRSYLEIACAQNDVTFVWMRIFFVYGPDQREQSLIPTVIEALAKNKEPDVRSPYAGNDFVYVDDVIEGLKCALSQKVPSGIFNLGRGEETTVIEVVRCIEERMTAKTLHAQAIEDRYSENADRPTSFFAHLEKSRELLGWKATTDLPEGIKKFLEWRESND